MVDSLDDTVNVNCITQVPTTVISSVYLPLSITYKRTLIEPEKLKGSNGVLSFSAIAYAILNQEFSLNLVVIMFSPWRQLALVLALFLGFAALGVHFFYESPKFLLNAGREEEALHVLSEIWRRNGGEKKVKNYPVSK